MIDMYKLKSMSLDEDGVLHVGAGAKWGDIYTYIEEHDRGAIGGRQKDVGIEGYIPLGLLMPCFWY